MTPYSVSRVKCPTCKGQGVATDDAILKIPRLCVPCGGTGYVKREEKR